MKLAAEKIRQNGWVIGGITGIRSLDDVKVLNSIYGEDFILIAVYVSNPEVRFQRMLKRGEGRDPHSYTQFLRQDEAEEETFHIQSAVRYADYSISNDGSLDDLHCEIDRLIAEKNLLVI